MHAITCQCALCEAYAKECDAFYQVSKPMHEPLTLSDLEIYSRMAEISEQTNRASRPRPRLFNRVVLLELASALVMCGVAWFVYVAL